MYRSDPYSSLVGLLVWINLFLMSTWRGIEAALNYCGAAPWGRWNSCEWDPTLPLVFLANGGTLFLWNLSYKACPSSPLAHSACEAPHKRAGWAG